MGQAKLLVAIIGDDKKKGKSSRQKEKAGYIKIFRDLSLFRYGRISV